MNKHSTYVVLPGHNMKLRVEKGKYLLKRKHTLLLRVYVKPNVYVLIARLDKNRCSKRKHGGCCVNGKQNERATCPAFLCTHQYFSRCACRRVRHRTFFGVPDYLTRVSKGPSNRKLCIRWYVRIRIYRRFGYIDCLYPTQNMPESRDAIPGQSGRVYQV